MKILLTLAAMSLVASQSFGATVVSARLDSSNKNILIDVVYGGGCGDHDFSLRYGPCLETFPVQCSAELVHKTNDTCEALIQNTVMISLEKEGLTDPYFEKAALTITGDKDWRTSKPSQVTVRLP